MLLLLPQTTTYALVKPLHLKQFPRFFKVLRQYDEKKMRCSWLLGREFSARGVPQLIVNLVWGLSSQLLLSNDSQFSHTQAVIFTQICHRFSLERSHSISSFFPLHFYVLFKCPKFKYYQIFRPFFSLHMIYNIMLHFH